MRRYSNKHAVTGGCSRGVIQGLGGSSIGDVQGLGGSSREDVQGLGGSSRGDIQGLGNSCGGMCDAVLLQMGWLAAILFEDVAVKHGRNNLPSRSSGTWLAGCQPRMEAQWTAWSLTAAPVRHWYSMHDIQFNTGAGVKGKRHM